MAPDIAASKLCAPGVLLWIAPGRGMMVALRARPLTQVMNKSLVRSVVFALLGLGLTAAATAQLLHQRQLPRDGLRGELGAPLPLPMVQIGREVLRLAPGGVVYDAQNRTILQSALPPEGAVLYTKDANGDVQRLYLLTPSERAMLDSLPRK
jgi:hypothetical protein